MRKTRGKRRTFRKMFGGVHENTPGTSTANKRQATLKSRASALASAFSNNLTRMTSVFKPGATDAKFENKNDIYEGELNDKGQRHGKGIMRYKNGDVYAGYWKDGKMHGVGKMTFKDGKKYNGVVETSYYGEWQNGQMHGKGTMTNANEAEYSATWRDGIMQTTPRHKVYALRDENNKIIGYTDIPPDRRYNVD